MAYGFDNDRSKVEMYTKNDVYTKEEVDDYIADIIPADAFSNVNTVKDYIDTHRNSGYPNCVLLGDSWTDINSLTVIDGVNWTTRLPWWTFHNYARGGAGFLVSGNTYEAQAIRAVNDTSYNHNDVTHCLIVGGVNDFRNGSQNSADYTGPIRTIVNMLHNSFRNAKIVIIFASTERTYLGSQAPATWIDSWSIWNTIKRWCDNTLPGSEIGPVECHVITYLFPDSSFITWGDPNYHRHLSKTGHRQLATAIEHILRTGEVPALMLRMSSAIESTNANITLSDLCGVLTNECLKLRGYLSVSADVSSAQAYVDVSPTNDSHFDTNPQEGVFCATFTDIFPKLYDQTVNSYSTYPQSDRIRATAGIAYPLWGSTVTDATTFPIIAVGVLPYYANNPIRLRFDVKNVVDGSYTFDFNFPFISKTNNNLLLRVGTYDIEDM